MSGYEPQVIEPVTITFAADGGAVETKILTSNVVNTPGDNATVVLHGMVYENPGTAGTIVEIKVYRGSWTRSYQIGSTIAQLVTAGSQYSIPFDAVDTPGDVADLTYDVTVAVANATANGTVEYASVAGFVS